MKYNDPTNFNFSKEHAPNWENDDIKKVDIGCGYRPIPNCDAYVDLYPDSIEERAFGRTPDWCRDRLTICNIENMPFQEKEFDFSYARSILEHVENPDKACEELMRISKGGYITSPSPLGELKNNWKYHKWFVWNRGGELFFLNKYLDHTQYLQEWNCLDKEITVFNWSDKFNFKVIL